MPGVFTLDVRENGVLKVVGGLFGVKGEGS